MDRPSNNTLHRAPVELGRIPRKVALRGIWIILLYVGVASGFLLVAPIAPGRQAGIVGLTALVPLLASGSITARIAARHQAARARRHWRLFGIACAFMACGMSGWVLASTIRNSLVAAVGSAATVIALPLFIRALASRARYAGSVFNSRLDLLDLLIVISLSLGYTGTFVWTPMLNRYGYAVTILLVGGFVVVVAACYATLLLLRRESGTISPADRVLLVPFMSIAAFQIVATAYLWLIEGPAGPALFVAGLVGLAPLPLLPLVDGGLLYHSAPKAAPKQRSSAIVLIALIALPPLYIYPFASRALLDWQILLRGGTTLAVASLIAARQITMLSENRRLADTQLALARLWKREATRGEALLGLLRRVAEGKELTVVLDAALSAVVETTGAKRAFFFTNERGGRGHVVRAIGLGADEVAEIEAVSFDPMKLFRTIADGRTVAYSGEPVPGLSETSSKFGEKQLAAVAITGWESGGIGALCCDAGDSNYVFKAEDLDMLEAIIDHITIDLGRERLFRELAASEERYRLLVEDATDGVCELDVNDRILFTNAAFANMVGMPIASIPGRRLEEILNIEKDTATEGSRELLASIDRDGEMCHLELRTAIRRDGRVQAVVRDITDRMLAAERIESLYRELQEKERARASAFAQLITASDDERAKVASDLHDGPVQELSTLAIQLDLAKTVLKRGEVAKAEELLVEIRKRISREVLALRHLMMELRPPVLDERGLSDAIENYAKTFELETGITVDFRDTVRARFSKPIETVLYRITQEALANVRKHSMARQVEITLTVERDSSPDEPHCMAHLTIADDGVGFDVETSAAALTRGHIGLASMKERAELAGGECTVRSNPGEGTVVQVKITTPVMSYAEN